MNKIIFFLNYIWNVQIGVSVEIFYLWIKYFTHEAIKIKWDNQIFHLNVCILNFLNLYMKPRMFDKCYILLFFWNCILNIECVLLWWAWIDSFGWGECKIKFSLYFYLVIVVVTLVDSRSTDSMKMNCILYQCII